MTGEVAPVGLSQQTLPTMELHSLVRYPGDVVKIGYLGRQGFAAICAGSRSDSLLVYVISTGAMTDERCFELLSKFTCEDKYTGFDSNKVPLVNIVPFFFLQSMP